MNPLQRLRRALPASVSRRARTRRRLEIESLEERLVLSTPSAAINSITINLNTPGPTSIAGRLNPGNEIAAYRIDGSAGEVLQFHNVSVSSTSGSWFLLGENNQEVAGTSLGTDFTANLTVTSPYYLELVGNSTPEIDYSFQVSDQASYPPPSSSGFNAEQTGTLASGASTSFTYTAPGGLPVYFNSLGFSEPMSATLTDAHSNNVFSYTPYYSGNKGPYLLPDSGSYTLTLTNNSGASGTYDFNLLSLPDVATSLALGPTQTVAGTLSPGDSTAVYSFLGATTERLFLDNEQPLGDPVNLQLIQPDGGPVFNIGSYSDSGPLSLTENGTYYLLVEGGSSSPINYQFRLTDTAYSPVTLGTTVDGTLGNATATDVYSFTGTAQERVYFQAVSESNPYYTATWELYGPNNQPVAGGNYFTDFSATLPTDGNYTLVVGNSVYATYYGYGSSTYSFATYVNVDPTSALTLGTEVTGTLVNPGDEATYTFTGSPGQQIYFDGRESGGSSIYAALTDPSGTQVFNQAMANDAGPYTLTQAGTYTLTVSGSGATTGAYDFVVDDTSAAPTIATNTVVSDTVPTGFSTNLYQISGTAGERIYFQAQSITDSSSNPDPYYYLGWALYGPNSQQIASPYYGEFSDFTATLPADGTYVLAVAGEGYTTSSIDYSFEAFQTVTSTTPMTLGTEEMGTLANPGDQALYTFTGSSGQNIFFDGLSADSGINASLTNPSGNQIFNVAAGSDAGPYTLSEPGTYTLTIAGGGNTGNFDFRMLDSSAQALAPSSTPTTVSDPNLPGTGTDIYQLMGTAGEQLTLTIDSFS